MKPVTVVDNQLANFISALKDGHFLLWCCVHYRKTTEKFYASDFTTVFRYMMAVVVLQLWKTSETRTIKYQPEKKLCDIGGVWLIVSFSHKNNLPSFYNMSYH
jgi:hypothetical protein